MEPPGGVSFHDESSSSMSEKTKAGEKYFFSINYNKFLKKINKRKLLRENWNLDQDCKSPEN